MERIKKLISLGLVVLAISCCYFISNDNQSANHIMPTELTGSLS